METACSPFLILDLCLYVVDSIGGLDFKGDSLAGEGLYENLHGEIGERVWNETSGTEVDSYTSGGVSSLHRIDESTAVNVTPNSRIFVHLLHYSSNHNLILMSFSVPADAIMLL